MNGSRSFIVSESLDARSNSSEVPNSGGVRKNFICMIVEREKEKAKITIIKKGEYAFEGEFLLSHSH